MVFDEWNSFKAAKFAAVAAEQGQPENLPRDYLHRL